MLNLTERAFRFDRRAGLIAGLVGCSGKPVAGAIGLIVIPAPCPAGFLVQVGFCGLRDGGWSAGREGDKATTELPC